MRLLDTLRYVRGRLKPLLSRDPFKAALRYKDSWGKEVIKMAVWEPFREFAVIEREMQRILDNLWGETSTRGTLPAPLSEKSP